MPAATHLRDSLASKQKLEGHDVSMRYDDPAEVVADRFPELAPALCSGRTRMETGPCRR